MLEESSGERFHGASEWFPADEVGNVHVFVCHLRCTISFFCGLFVRRVYNIVFCLDFVMWSVVCVRSTASRSYFINTHYICNSDVTYMCIYVKVCAFLCIHIRYCVCVCIMQICIYMCLYTRINMKRKPAEIYSCLTVSDANLAIMYETFYFV